MKKTALLLLTAFAAIVSASQSVPISAYAQDPVRVVRDPRFVHAETDTDFLKTRCSEFDEYYASRTQQWADAQALMSRFSSSCYGRSCFRMPMKRKKALASLGTCHDASVKLALDPKSACYYPILTKAGSKETVFKTPVDFCSVLTSVEGTGRVTEFFDSFKDLKACIHAASTNKDSEALARLMMDNPACLMEMSPDQFSCKSFHPNGEEYVSLLHQQNDLERMKVQMTTAAGSTCTLKTVSDADELWETRDQASLKCLEQSAKSCKLVLKSAQLKAEQLRKAAENNSQTYPMGAGERVNQSLTPVVHSSKDSAPAVKPGPADAGKATP